MIGAMTGTGWRNRPRGLIVCFRIPDKIAIAVDTQTDDQYRHGGRSSAADRSVRRRKLR
jgi:hypothetical protein